MLYYLSLFVALLKYDLSREANKCINILSYKNETDVDWIKLHPCPIGKKLFLNLKIAQCLNDVF